MGKPNRDMRDALQKGQTQKPELEIVESVPESHSQRCPSRRGKKMAACYLSMDAYRQTQDTLCRKRYEYRGRTQTRVGFPVYCEQQATDCLGLGRGLPQGLSLKCVLGHSRKGFSE